MYITKHGIIGTGKVPSIIQSCMFSLWCYIQWFQHLWRWYGSGRNRESTHLQTWICILSRRSRICDKGYLCAAKGPGEVLRHTERTHMSGRFTLIFICTVCLCVHVCENGIEF
ncbi:hypothetical protein GBAR_LOCUS3964 [Geodia barretti]|uniref:Uncharacterized protein n=1 Tax=Geodia barretti TaxID=519541 RepID=A0AA35R5W3_GEOBA|nr:hypothetical protein GBAR_LOCUS3964 [Geodia barretti]